VNGGTTLPFWHEDWVSPFDLLFYWATIGHLVSKMPCNGHKKGSQRQNQTKAQESARHQGDQAQKGGKKSQDN
jgi:hypothetical protein